MRLVAFMPQASVIDQLLPHLRTRARPPRPRPPHAYRPRRPAPQRGRLACAAVPPRRHRGLRRPSPPPLTAAGAARTAPGREAGHAAASHAVPARSAITPYVRRIIDRPRLKCLSRCCGSECLSRATIWRIPDITDPSNRNAAFGAEAFPFLTQLRRRSASQPNSGIFRRK